MTTGTDSSSKGGARVLCCMAVCLSVLRSHISKTTRPNVIKFSVHVSYLWPWFALLWRQCNTLYTSGFVDDVIFFHIMEPMGQNQARRYVSSNSPDGGTGNEVCPLLTLKLFSRFWRNSGEWYLSYVACTGICTSMIYKNTGYTREHSEKLYMYCAIKILILTIRDKIVSSFSISRQNINGRPSVPCC